jgi:hypothetical protein
MLAGAAFVLELCGWADALDDDRALASATHPFPTVRVAFGRAMLTRLGVELADRRLVELVDRVADRASEDRRRAAELVAEVVLDEPLAALKGGAVRDLDPGAARDHRLLLAAVGELTTGPSARAVTRTVPYRLLPSLARLGISLGQPATAVADAVFAEATVRPVPEAAPFKRQRFTQRTLRAITAPILDEEQDGLKLAPPGLFAAASAVTFVGATNDGLPKLFEDFAKERRPHKRRIELFFLSDTALGGLATDGRDARATRELRAAALRGLDRAALDGVAEEWALYEHDEPYFFASYWDAARPGGRIHVSNHGWGLDLKRAPSIDHVWSSAAERPDRTYQWYLDALDGLKSRARRLEVR